VVVRNDYETRMRNGDFRNDQGDRMTSGQAWDWLHFRTTRNAHDVIRQATNDVCSEKQYADNIGCVRDCWRAK